MAEDIGKQPEMISATLQAAIDNIAWSLGRLNELTRIDKNKKLQQENGGTVSEDSDLKDDEESEDEENKQIHKKIEIPTPVMYMMLMYRKRERLDGMVKKKYGQKK